MKIISIFIIGIKKLLIILGAIFLLLFILSLTSVPYSAYRSLSLYKQQIEGKPDAIILMGGSGFPSPNDLIRLYYTSIAAKENPEAKIVIAMPFQGLDSIETTSAIIQKMQLDGIDGNRIFWANQGFNTRSQVVEISNLIPLSSKIMVVSTPDHMYRAVRCFEKVGFGEVASLPTFEIPPDEMDLLNKKDSEITELQNLNLRYNMWSYLQYEIMVLREYTAITYYWLHGWI